MNICPRPVRHVKSYKYLFEDVLPSSSLMLNETGRRTIRLTYKHFEKTGEQVTIALDAAGWQIIM